MDPELVWGEFSFAIAEERHDDAREFAPALLEWLEKGGAIPKDMARWNEGKTRQDLISWVGCYVG